MSYLNPVFFILIVLLFNTTSAKAGSFVDCSSFVFTTACEEFLVYGRSRSDSEEEALILQKQLLVNFRKLLNKNPDLYRLSSYQDAQSRDRLIVTLSQKPIAEGLQKALDRNLISIQYILDSLCVDPGFITNLMVLINLLIELDQSLEVPTERIHFFGQLGVCLVSSREFNRLYTLGFGQLMTISHLLSDEEFERLSHQLCVEQN
ncbi:hypothetical protein ACH42_06045 [Endozoicomonas sp. (ex Bugula neritina AB1)]|nr:hypothetical protein ACH42_06045 [Endozoicomonas sp. (ex Bugula neritina AB1)]